MVSNIRTFLFNTLCLVCGCVFIIFEIQSAFFDRSAEEFSPPPPAPYTLDVDDLPQTPYKPIGKISEPVEKTSNLPQIWITMGLCWSSNTQYWGKEHFPYKESAPLSSQLWMRLTPAKVILQVVYSEPKPPDDLLKYKQSMLDCNRILFYQ